VSPFGPGAPVAPVTPVAPVVPVSPFGPWASWPPRSSPASSPTRSREFAPVAANLRGTMPWTQEPRRIPEALSSAIQASTSTSRCR
jgi:hypothetical protein